METLGGLGTLIEEGSRAGLFSYLFHITAGYQGNPVLRCGPNSSLTASA